MTETPEIPPAVIAATEAMRDAYNAGKDDYEVAAVALAAALPHRNPKAAVCTCRTIALSGWDTVQQAVDPRCPIHHEPTFTASELKERLETATTVALALGRKEALEDFAATCGRRAQIAGRIPESQRSGVREGMLVAWLAAQRLAEKTASQPAKAVSNGLTAVLASPSTPEESKPAESAFPDLPEGSDQ